MEKTAQLVGFAYNLLSTLRMRALECDRQLRNNNPDVIASSNQQTRQSTNTLRYLYFKDINYVINSGNVDIYSDCQIVTEGKYTCQRGPKSLEKAYHLHV